MIPAYAGMTLAGMTLARNLVYYDNLSTMKNIDLTFPTPGENLACDEALLDLGEEGFKHEILRFWEPREHFVVLGYSNKIREEVNYKRCRKKEIPVLRRPSGGGAVLQGPGCLNFSLILKIDGRAPLKSIRETNRFVLEHHCRALSPVLGRKIEIEGTSDLTLGGLKFSGNAQRRKRRHLLYHGTFLLDLDMDLVENLLPMPSRQPAYRQSRPHRQFLTNLKVPSHRIKDALKKAWSATNTLQDVPSGKIQTLIHERYSQEDWNARF